MSILGEFKAFAMRGNAIDLAVGVVVGAAFSGIVSSLVKDIINPPLGMLLGGIDFSNFYVVLSGNDTYPTLAAWQLPPAGFRHVPDTSAVSLCASSALAFSLIGAISSSGAAT